MGISENLAKANGEPRCCAAAEMADSKTAYWEVSEISEKAVRDICDVAGGTALMLGFAAADCDFAALGALIRKYLAAGIELLLVSTEGEIHRQDGCPDLYCPAEKDRQKLVVQTFSRRMLKQVQILSVPLPDDDIRKNRVNMAVEQRIALITKELQKQRLQFAINARDTVALAYSDGMSLCENFAMQAVYESRRFPCAFVGGSAGADAAKRHTYIYDGEQVLEGRFLICLLKMQPGYRFATFHTDNIGKVLKEYTILDADATLQTVYKVVDKEQGCRDLVAVLQELFQCPSIAELRQTLQQYGFGTKIDGKVYARDLRHIEEAHNCLHFYCGFAMGEKILLLQNDAFAPHVRRDWQRFIKGKPRPFAGILHDCTMHRRQEKRADFADLFAGIAVSGLSCRGEFLGLPLNNAMASLFFFKTEPADFADKNSDDFPIQYAEFKSYFTLRRLKHIQIVNDMERKAREIMETQGLPPQQLEAGPKAGGAKEAFSQALNGYNVEKVLGYKGEKKMRKMLDAMNDGAADSPAGQVSTLVAYMQIMMDQLHGQRHILEKKVKEMENFVRFYAKDELTNAYARRSGYEIIEQTLCSPPEKVEFLTMAFIDIDNLKTANDIWGHEEGDFYLKTAINAIRAITTQQDIICRYGGDEFILVLPNKLQEQAIDLLRKANAELAAISSRRAKGYGMSFSFGTLFHDYSEQLNIEKALAKMDKIMYHYKAGKGEKKYCQES